MILFFALLVLLCLPLPRLPTLRLRFAGTRVQVARCHTRFCSPLSLSSQLFTDCWILSYRLGYCSRAFCTLLLPLPRMHMPDAHLRFTVTFRCHVRSGCGCTFLRVLLDPLYGCTFLCAHTRTRLRTRLLALPFWISFWISVHTVCRVTFTFARWFTRGLSRTHTDYHHLPHLRCVLFWITALPFTHVALPRFTVTFTLYVHAHVPARISSWFLSFALRGYAHVAAFLRGCAFTFVAHALVAGSFAFCRYGYTRTVLSFTRVRVTRWLPFAFTHDAVCCCYALRLPFIRTATRCGYGCCRLVPTHRCRAVTHGYLSYHPLLLLCLPGYVWFCVGLLRRALDCAPRCRLRWFSGLPFALPHTRIYCAVPFTYRRARAHTCLPVLTTTCCITGCVLGWFALPFTVCCVRLHVFYLVYTHMRLLHVLHVLRLSFTFCTLRFSRLSFLSLSFAFCVFCSPLVSLLLCLSLSLVAGLSFYRHVVTLHVPLSFVYADSGFVCVWVALPHRLRICPLSLCSLLSLFRLHHARFVSPQFVYICVCGYTLYARCVARSSFLSLHVWIADFPTRLLRFTRIVSSLIICRSGFCALRFAPFAVLRTFTHVAFVHTLPLPLPRGLLDRLLRLCVPTALLRTLRVLSFLPVATDLSFLPLRCVHYRCAFTTHGCAFALPGCTFIVRCRLLCCVIGLRGYARSLDRWVAFLPTHLLRLHCVRCLFVAWILCVALHLPDSSLPIYRVAAFAVTFTLRLLSAVTVTVTFAAVTTTPPATPAHVPATTMHLPAAHTTRCAAVTHTPRICYHTLTTARNTCHARVTLRAQLPLPHLPAAVAHRHTPHTHTLPPCLPTPTAACCLLLPRTNARTHSSARGLPHRCCARAVPRAGLVHIISTRLRLPLHTRGYGCCLCYAHTAPRLRVAFVRSLSRTYCVYARAFCHLCWVLSGFTTTHARFTCLSPLSLRISLSLSSVATLARYVDCLCALLPLRLRGWLVATFRTVTRGCCVCTALRVTVAVAVALPRFSWVTTFVLPRVPLVWISHRLVARTHIHCRTLRLRCGYLWFAYHAHTAVSLSFSAFARAAPYRCRAAFSGLWLPAHTAHIFAAATLALLPGCARFARRAHRVRRYRLLHTAHTCPPRTFSLLIIWLHTRVGLVYLPHVYLLHLCVRLRFACDAHGSLGCVAAGCTRGSRTHAFAHFTHVRVLFCWILVGLLPLWFAYALRLRVATRCHVHSVTLPVPARLLLPSHHLLLRYLVTAHGLRALPRYALHCHGLRAAVAVTRFYHRPATLRARDILYVATCLRIHIPRLPRGCGCAARVCVPLSRLRVYAFAHWLPHARLRVYAAFARLRITGCARTFLATFTHRVARVLWILRARTFARVVARSLLSLSVCAARLRIARILRFVTDLDLVAFGLYTLDFAWFVAAGYTFTFTAVYITHTTRTHTFALLPLDCPFVYVLPPLPRLDCYTYTHAALPFGLPLSVAVAVRLRPLSFWSVSLRCARTFVYVCLRAAHAFAFAFTFSPLLFAFTRCARVLSFAGLYLSLHAFSHRFTRVAVSFSRFADFSLVLV